jgi:hypothetical protein
LCEQTGSDVHDSEHIYEEIMKIYRSIQQAQGTPNEKANDVLCSNDKGVRRFGTWAHWSPLFKPSKISNFKV